MDSNQFDLEDLQRLISRRQQIFGTFDYQNRTHKVVQESFEDEETPATYMFPSDSVSGITISVYANTDPRFLKPIIFHEMVEWSIRERFRLGESYTYREGSRKFAHERASKLDERYAAKIFDAEELEEYISYKRRFEKAIERG